MVEIHIPGHVELRPGWSCRACSRPWPCQTARRDLKQELSPTYLKLNMWLSLQDAIEDMPQIPTAILQRRFMHWTGDSSLGRGWPTDSRAVQPHDEDVEIWAHDLVRRPGRYGAGERIRRIVAQLLTELCPVPAKMSVAGRG
jgi:hypothetical protein